MAARTKKYNVSGAKISSKKKSSSQSGHVNKELGIIPKLFIGFIGAFFLIVSIETMLGDGVVSTEVTPNSDKVSAKATLSEPVMAVPISTKRTGNQFYPLEIIEAGWELNEYGELYVIGKAKNLGNKKLSYAQIDVNFYAADGSIHGYSYDNINNLGPKEVWSFSVPYLGDEQPKGGYKITRVSTSS